MKVPYLIYCLILLNSLAWLAAGWNEPSVSGENGWLESFQVFCIVAGIAVLPAVVRRAASPPLRLMYLGVWLFYFNVLLREISLKHIGLPDFLVSLGNGAARNWLLGVGWLILAVLFFRRRRETTRIIFSWLKTVPGRLLVGAVLFYVAGLPFDKKIFGLGGALNELLEEVMEANAALLMAASAVFSLTGFRRSGEESLSDSSGKPADEVINPDARAG